MRIPIFGESLIGASNFFGVFMMSFLTNFLLLLLLQDVSPRIVLQNHDMRQQQSEERVKSISEQLANALADITTKDNLVKQHVKVTEEAVSGIYN